MTQAPAAEFVHVFVEREGVGLFLQHRDNKPGIYEPGRLGTWGGSIELGETAVDAAIREAYEELNLRLLPRNLLHLGNLVFDSTDTIGVPLWKHVEAYLTLVPSRLNIPVREGQGGITVFFGERLPAAPRLTRIVAAEMLEYFPGSFPNVKDFLDEAAA